VLASVAVAASAAASSVAPLLIEAALAAAVAFVAAPLKTPASDLQQVPSAALVAQLERFVLASVAVAASAAALVAVAASAAALAASAAASAVALSVVASVHLGAAGLALDLVEQVVVWASLEGPRVQMRCHPLGRELRAAARRSASFRGIAGTPTVAKS